MAAKDLHRSLKSYGYRSSGGASMFASLGTEGKDLYDHLAHGFHAHVRGLYVLYAFSFL
jgi:hypothetical protein